MREDYLGENGKSIKRGEFIAFLEGGSKK